MILYKYFSPSLAQVLENGKLRYSPPSVLNDPFELKPHISAIAPESEIIKKYIEVAAPQMQSLKAEFSAKVGRAVSEDELFKLLFSVMPLKYVTEQVNLRSSQVQTTLAEQFEKVGMLCLTEKYDNLLMWAHYAESHAGFVLGFDTSDPHFHQRRSDKDELRHIRKVKYTDVRPETILIDGPSYDVFISKGRIWEYEQEWRILRPLQDADEVKEIPGLDVPIHLFEFPWECLRSIRLGARMTKTNQDKILDLVSKSQQLSHVEVFKAEVSERLFALDFHRI
jgi:hypothetical protein